MLMQTHEARLSALREELKRRGLDGFVVPISDEHMSEYIGGYAQRLAWLTGFGGSAGSAVVLKDRAAMFTDGRYTIQVREQVDGKLYDYCLVPQESIGKWIADNAPAGAKIGFDPWLHTKGWADQVGKALAKKGVELVALESNPVDAVWADRPEPSTAAALVHAAEHAGRSSAEKRAEVADWLKEEGYDAAVVSALDSIAWLLNIRGEDVERTPLGDRGNDRVAVSAIGLDGLSTRFGSERFRGVLRSGVGECNLGAVAGEAADDRGADPSAAAEDEDVLVCETGHDVILVDLCSGRYIYTVPAIRKEFCSDC